MSKDSKQSINARVKQWVVASPILQEVRDESIRKANTDQALKCFTGMVLAALPEHPPRPWSGLVEQQRFFRKIAR
jgi:hypothetical protein